MSISRIPLLWLALTLLPAGIGYCQPPQRTAAGNFKYAHTAYPTTSYPTTTSANPQSEWISDKDSQLQAASEKSVVPKTGEATKKVTSKPKANGVPSFRKWFSRSNERPMKGRPQPSTIVETTSLKKEQAPGLVAPPSSMSSHSSSATNANQTGRQIHAAIAETAAAINDKVDAADRNAAAVSGITPTNAKAPTKGAVIAAFGGILPDESRRKEVSQVQATTATPNQVQTAFGSAAQVLPPNVAKQAIATNSSAENPLNRPKIIFQPVSGGVDSRGNALLRPSVQVADDAIATGADGIQLAQFEEDTLPPPQVQQSPEMAYPIDDEWMPPVVANDCETCSEGYGSGNFGHHMHGHGHGFGHGHKKASGYAGVGREYVMHAPFFLDRTEPYNNCFIRGDAAANWEFPDRAEYFWAKTPGPKGPRPDIMVGEPAVDYQDIVFSIERGGERFSVATDIPIRAVDPEIRGCTTGLGDMEVTSRIVFLDGCRWQLTQLFSTHLPTGSFRRGTGNGHVSLEPGVAYRYKWNDETYIHGDLTYLFPIAADPFFSGQILNYGIGISHVWIDADTYALIPTFEVDAFTVLDGQQTLPFSIATEEVDSIGIVNVHPGLRWVCDKGGDCGVKEFGISSGVAVTRDSWYEELLRIEFRWSR